MTNQHRATDEQWAKVKNWAPRYPDCSCLIELRDRIRQLEAAQQAPDPYSGRPSSLTDDQRKTAAALAGARCAIEQLGSKPGSWRPAKPAPSPHPPTLVDDQPVQQFIAKYLFTASNILQDSFRFDFNNSVLFDLCINGEHLAPGDGIKIAHRLGEVPASGVYSTINYKVASVLKVDDGVWAIRAVRVDTSDSEPAPTDDDQLTLVEEVARIIARFASEGLPGDDARPPASAVIREVAAWLRNGNGSSGAWSQAASDLERESNR
jgi:hypothetical protein